MIRRSVGILSAELIPILFKHPKSCVSHPQSVVYNDLHICVQIDRNKDNLVVEHLRGKGSRSKCLALF